MQILSQYNLTVDNMQVVVRISSDKARNNKYELVTKELSKATRALLNIVREQLVSDVEIGSY